MNIGYYTFAEFKTLAEHFHGYAAPGLLIGGAMVERAKACLPEGTFFEAIVETRKCLPDAVQLLTLCSTGNNRLKIYNLGRYALSLFDKQTGKGVRVSIRPELLTPYPEIQGWFLKKTPKTLQNEQRLLAEIEAAGDSLCAVEPVQIQARFLGHAHMETIGICPLCGEAYPQEDGPTCRGCQGEAPYQLRNVTFPQKNLRIVPAEEAVGKTLVHDMTRIEPGVFKGPEFQAGQHVTAGDICRLQQMGRFHIAVQEETPPDDLVHENEIAELFAHRMAGRGVRYTLPPHEGKIDFEAEYDGLLCVDTDRLFQLNMLPEIMAAARQDATLVKAKTRLAGTRAIPLFLPREQVGRALAVLGETPLFEVLPLRRARIGILVTGTEVFQGIIEDKFVPVITAKAQQMHCTVVHSVLVPDDAQAIVEAVHTLRQAGADMLVTTGGLSVDPDDLTRLGLLQAGLEDVLHGIPVLPGAMGLVGRIPGASGFCEMQVLGVPACALYYKTTVFDLLFPRLLSGRGISRKELARLGDGGYCLGCKICTYPKCSFGK